MKKIIVVCLLVLINGCSSQKIKNNLKENTMEYFDINKYKDWETNTEYVFIGKDKYLKKGEERISIEYFNDAVQINLNTINSPYYKFKKFSLKTNRLLLIGTKFYTIHIGIWENYDETGQLIKKIDCDKPYKFSIEDLIKKMKNEYDIDLLDVKRVSYVLRYEEKEDVNLPLYEVCYKYNPSIGRLVSCYLINGTTGETLFTIKRYLGGNNKGSLLDNYLDSLKNEEQKKSAVFRTYEGKTYTEEQWKVKEEELWNQYTQKHNLRTAIDIEKERNKKGGGFFLGEKEVTD